MTARIREFHQFLDAHVDLNATRLNTLQSRVSTINTYLSESKDLEEIVDNDVIPQGSFAHKTIIKPFTGNDFDADVLVPMNEIEGWEPKHYTENLNKALSGSKNYIDKCSLGKRCVQIDYAGDFHIDLVPFVTLSDGLTYITHRTRNEFLRQDPVAFTTWIQEQNKASNGHLLRVVRLMKYLRDRSSVTIPSVVLTALLAGQVQSFAGINDYKNLPQSLVSLVGSLNSYLGALSAAPWVDDQIGQNLADRWTKTGFEGFQSRMKTWAIQMEEALAAPADESITAWQKVFGTGFQALATESSASHALTAGALSIPRKQPAPGEQDITTDFGIDVQLNPTYRVKLVGRVASGRRTSGRFRPISATGNFVPIGRDLRFTIDECNVPEPYDVYWKVRNDGEQARRRNMFRGDIVKGTSRITESSDFEGSHWVQVWIVKNHLALATDIQDVSILAN